MQPRLSTTDTESFPHALVNSVKRVLLSPFTDEDTGGWGHGRK